MPCPPPSILGTLFMPVRCEASERLQPLLDRKTVPICNITSISLTLVHLATLAIAITRSRNCINHDSLSHISGTLQAPYRQSLNRHLENVLFMLLVWLGYELITGDWPLVTTGRCPYVKRKVNTNESGHCAVACPPKMILLTQPTNKVPLFIRGRL